MKHLRSMLILCILTLTLALPVFAQDTTTTPVSNTTLTLNYVLVTVLALLLIAALIFGAYITGWLAKLVPPETAASIYQSGVRFGFQVALNKAAETPSEADDEFFLELARSRGLPVEKTTDADGSIHYIVKTSPSGARTPGGL